MTSQTSAPSTVLGTPEVWDDLAVLRAGIRFAHRVGRPPKRLDFREPARSEWEAKLFLPLPTADQAANRFGTWGGYLDRMGYGPHADGNATNDLIEAAAMIHLEDTYPGLQAVQSEQNAWDAVHTFDPVKGPERIEVKGSALARRKDHRDQLFFSFKIHGRDLSKTVDRLILVGLGWDPEASVDEQVLVPVTRLEFPKSALRQVDGKSTVMVYASAIYGASHSIYRPFVRWRRPIPPAELTRYIRKPREVVGGP